MDENMGSRLSISSMASTGKTGDPFGPSMNDKAHFQTAKLPSAIQRSGGTPDTPEGSAFGQAAATPIVTGTPNEGLSSSNSGW